MRATLKLIVTLLLVLAALFIVSSLWQVRTEKARLKSELERNAGLLADSFREAVRPALAEGHLEKLAPIADEFSNREDLLGLCVHDKDGRLVAGSSGVFGAAESPKAVRDVVQTAVRQGRPAGDFMRLGERDIHAYSTPVLTGAGEYAVTVFHKAGFIHERLRRIWLMNLLRIAVIWVLVSATTLGVFYLNVMRPIRKTADWIKKVRMGEAKPDQLSPAEERLLGPIAKEISKLAISLVQAREAAEEEARLRQSSESLWTPERLKEFVRLKLQGRPLFVVSNREPYQHVKKGKEIECVVPASGLVTALEPVLKACGGTWIAEGNGDADRETVDESDRLRVPPEEPQYTLRRVWLTKEEEAGYYYGFSNEGLWPLCHVAHTRPTFRETDWQAYEAVNKKFAKALLQELEGTSEPCVLIQDYHFALLPRLIKAERPDARVAIFWHIPWPNPESFSICPWQQEVLDGMLGADLIGFHTQYHCNNFVQTVDRILECRIDYEHFNVNREGHTTWIKPFPISIAFSGGESPATAPVSKTELLKPYGITADFVGVGVDRLDYTKGILERFRAVEHFLEKNPEYQGRFTFVELGAPSRSLIQKYQEFVYEVEREAERINARFKAKNWKAILLLKKHHSQKDIAPFYAGADVCMVTSLHDGMNLVAKEFVMARQDERGVLILSQFTGAARELSDAVIVNPYDTAQTAEAIRTALLMRPHEQEERMRRMRALLKDRNVYRWAADLIHELAGVRLDLHPTQAVNVRIL